MNDRETHVLINTEQHCVKSSLQWKWTDGKQTYEALGRKKENLIWHRKLQAIERNGTWMKIPLNTGFGCPISLALVFRCIGSYGRIRSPREANAIPELTPLMHTQTRPTHQPNSCLLQRKEFLSLGNEWLRYFKPISYLQFNKRFWTSSQSLM